MNVVELSLMQSEYRSIIRMEHALLSKKNKILNITLIQTDNPDEEEKEELCEDCGEYHMMAAYDDEDEPDIDINDKAFIAELNTPLLAYLRQRKEHIRDVFAKHNIHLAEPQKSKPHLSIVEE